MRKTLVEVAVDKKMPEEGKKKKKKRKKMICRGGLAGFKAPIRVEARPSSCIFVPLAATKFRIEPLAVAGHRGVWCGATVRGSFFCKSAVRWKKMPKGG